MPLQSIFAIVKSAFRGTRHAAMWAKRDFCPLMFKGAAGLRQGEGEVVGNNAKGGELNAPHEQQRHASAGNEARLGQGQKAGGESQERQRQAKCGHHAQAHGQQAGNKARQGHHIYTCLALGCATGQPKIGDSRKNENLSRFCRPALPAATLRGGQMVCQPAEGLLSATGIWV